MKSGSDTRAPATRGSEGTRLRERIWQQIDEEDPHASGFLMALYSMMGLAEVPSPLQSVLAHRLYDCCPADYRHGLELLKRWRAEGTYDPKHPVCVTQDDGIDVYDWGLMDGFLFAVCGSIEPPPEIHEDARTVLNQYAEHRSQGFSET